MNDPELSRGTRQLGLTSSGRVTLAGGTTFLQISTLALLTRTTLGVASVTKCQDNGKPCGFFLWWKIYTAIWLSLLNFL